MRRFWLTILLLNVLFVALAWPGYWLDPVTAAPLPLLAIEALLLAGFFALLPPHRLTRWLAYAGAAVFVAAALVIGFDVLVTVALGRALNVYLDFPLLRSAWDLSLTNLGGLATMLIAVFGTVAIVGIVLVIGGLLSRLTALPLRSAAVHGIAAMALGVTLLAFQTTGLTSAPGVDALHTQATRALATRQSHLDFVAELETVADTEAPVELAALRGRDVLLVFVESYGQEALVNPDYAPLISQRLDSMADTLAEADLSVISGMLTAPIQGGQSWLAHGSLLSGQWIDNQLDYESMLDSKVPTLVADFNASGHRTMAIMPANTRDWTEGDQYGFADVFDATNMDYAGPPFNFVTQPDQYTLHWFERHIRQTSDRPVFAELALISSHAPWVPVLPVLEWDDLDDGEVFHQYTDGHKTPEDVFRNNELVRDYYVRSIDYTLEVLTQYAVRYLGPDALLIVVGDHEAPPLVTGPDSDRSVPVHLISGQPELLNPWLDMADTGTWRAGTMPELRPSPPGMDTFRGLLHQLYGADAD